MMDKELLRQRIDIVDLIGKTVDLKKDGTRFKGLCPFHADRKSLSLVVYPDTRTWQCFGCGKHGDAFQWVMELEKVDFLAALARLQQQYGDTEGNVTTWNITDVDGNLIAQHFRYDHPDGTKTYSWNGQDGLGGIKAGELPLYGVKHLFAMETAAVNPIVIVEGEKATDALVKGGYAAVGTVTGASSCPNQEVFAPLIGFEARKYVWPDNDPAGRSHMDKVCGHLKALDIQPYVVNWVEAPDKGDAFDYIQQGGNVQALLDTAVPWEPVRESSPLLDNVTIYGYREQTLQAESPNNRYRNVTDSCCNGSVRRNRLRAGGGLGERNQWLVVNAGTRHRPGIQRPPVQELPSGDSVPTQRTGHNRGSPHGQQVIPLCEQATHAAGLQESVQCWRTALALAVWH
jgi:DNA primase